MTLQVKSHHHEDHRESTRIHLEMTAGVAIHSGGLFAPRKPALEATVIDVSLGGVELSTADPLRPGSTVLLWVNVTGQETPIKVKGRTVWSQPREDQGIHMSGIRLSDKPAREMKRWEEVVLSSLRMRGM